MLDFFLLGIRLARPLIATALGGVVAERAGVVNIALEGMMLAGAFASVAAASAFGLLPGVCAGVLVGAVIGLLHAVLTLGGRVPHILAGVGINLLVASGTTFLLRGYPDGTLETTGRIPENVATFATVFLVFAVAFVLYRTPTGLRLRAAGENPHTLRASGVAVRPLQYGAVIVSGALAGFGGTLLALAGLGVFTENMTAGRGYVALAAVIFGRWKPIPAAAAALVFGLGDAMQLSLQTAGVSRVVPTDLLALLPYVLTLLALFGMSGRNAAPAALGSTE